MLVGKPPKRAGWAFEEKWDGYRLAVHVEPGRVRIITRNGYDWTDRFPAIVAEACQLGAKTAILDGEAVVLDEEGAVGLRHAAMRHWSPAGRARARRKSPSPDCRV